MQYVLECLPQKGSKFFHLNNMVAPALMGLAPNFPTGRTFLNCMLQQPMAIETVFENSGKDRRSSTKEKGEQTGMLLASCTPKAVLYLLCDPYYCGMVESKFADLLLYMHEYIWPSAVEILQAFVPFFYKLLIHEPWAVEARRRVLQFLKKLFPLLEPETFSQV